MSAEGGGADGSGEDGRETRFVYERFIGNQTHAAKKKLGIKSTFNDDNDNSTIKACKSRGNRAKRRA